MKTKNLQISELDSLYEGEVFMTLDSQAEFDVVKSFVDEHNIICFIKDEATIYVRGIKYNGLDPAIKEKIIESIKDSLNETIDEKIREALDGIGNTSITLDDDVTQDSDNAVKSSGIFNAINGKFKIVTQQEYDESNKDPNTFYFIKK